MVRIISQLILTALLCTTTIVKAHIFMIEKWSNGSQDLYCLSDYHDSLLSQNQICNQQRIDIISAAKKLNAQVIVEDSMYFKLNDIVANPLQFDPNENFSHKMNKKHFTLEGLDKSITPITALTSHCHYANVPVDNVEFRLLKKLSIYNGVIDGKTAITSSDIAKDQILNYNDTPQLNAYYREKINEYIKNTCIPCNDFFEQLCNKACSLQEAIPEISYDKKLDNIFFSSSDAHNMNEDDKKQHILLIYDTTLLDLRIIHSIYINQKNSVLFVCAGANHIERIKPALELMGFVQTNRYELASDQDQEPLALDIHDYFSTQLHTQNTHSLPSFIYAFINVFMRLLWW